MRNLWTQGLRHKNGIGPAVQVFSPLTFQSVCIGPARCPLLGRACHESTGDAGLETLRALSYELLLHWAIHIFNSNIASSSPQSIVWNSILAISTTRTRSPHDLPGRRLQTNRFTHQITSNYILSEMENSHITPRRTPTGPMGYLNYPPEILNKIYHEVLVDDRQILAFLCSPDPAFRVSCSIIHDIGQESTTSPLEVNPEFEASRPPVHHYLIV